MVKTMNGLDPRFNLSEGDDPNHIFDEEYELIAEVKENLPEIQDYTDRFVLAFLFARKHNVKRTIKLIKEHIAFMEEQGYPPAIGGVNPVDIRELSNESGEETTYIEGMVDKQGRLLLYRKGKLFKPDQVDYNDELKKLTWFWYNLFEYASLNTLRNGMVVVNDMEGVDRSNVDFSKEGRKHHEISMSKFPGRLRAVYMCNSGFLFRAIMAFCRLFMKAKIIKRFKSISSDVLVDYIDDEYLLEEYGGSFSFDRAAYNEEILQICIEREQSLLAALDAPKKKKKRRRRKKKSVEPDDE
eukprot:TRINITY_DN2371_c0_g1_i1.p1 TRINITY_DN2371_c0_g1~~TRINITY_DN2371_c0_g1_i1.p1  ORF type:complete len:298 (+),score=92.84 TRINITY_DN2371_c0_g1_i1:137-1030(+)